MQPHVRDPNAPPEETTWQATWNWIIRPGLWLLAGLFVLGLIDRFGWGVLLLPAVVPAEAIAWAINKIAPTEALKVGLMLGIALLIGIRVLEKQIERLSNKVDRLADIVKERDRR